MKESDIKGMKIFLQAILLLLFSGCGLDLVGQYKDGDIPEVLPDDVIESIDIDVDQETPCMPGETLCGTECVDLNSDVNNCGACGNVCGEGEVCSEGSCESECSGDLTDCGGECVNTDTDVNHCGSCNNECPTPPNAEPVCEGGECGFNCLPGWSDINGLPEDGCEEECTIVSPDELCNGLDDNCDGQIDEGFDCIMGEEVACITTCGSGGTGFCTSMCTIPAPADCTPPEEMCNGEDDDCDGNADNGFDCIRGTEVDCITDCGTPGTGICTDACEIPTGTGCSAGDEICNGIDDNCNGESDETFPCVQGSSTSCTTTCGSTGTGVCGDDCSLPDPVDCTPPAEECNGLDDDCDGACDNGFGCCSGATENQSCGNCGTRSRTCSSSCVWGDWGICTGEGVCSPGATEAQPCGNCGTQTRTCTSSCAWGTWGSCTGEGVCAPAATRICTIGNCSGTQTCDATCAWGPCDLGPPPDNDLCTAATDVGSGGIFTGTTCAATNDFTTSSGCGNSGNSPDVVYWLNLSQRSFVTVDTCTSTLWDTVLYIDYDNECPPTGWIRCSNNACGTGEQSRIDNIALDPGGYYIHVDGYADNSSGPFVLNVNVTPTGPPPSNDECSGAIDISAGGTFSGDTTTATNDPGAACRGSSRSGVWYTFTLAQREVVYLDTQDGETWDTVITVRQGSCTGTEVLCGDDSCSNLRSQVAGVLDAGTYYVLVSGYATRNYGPFTLLFQHSSCPGATLLSWSSNNNGTTTGAGNDTSGSCDSGSSNAPDRAYYFAMCPITRNMRFSLCDGRGWDSVIYLRRGNGGTCGSTEVDCDDDSCTGGSNRSWMYYSTNTQGLYFVIVDGYQTSSDGQYTLYPWY